MWWAVGTAEPGCCENIADGGGPGAGRDASATRGETSGRKKAEVNKKELTMEKNSICQQKNKDTAFGSQKRFSPHNSQVFVLSTSTVFSIISFLMPRRIFKEGR